MLLSETELERLIRSAPRRYKVYQIPKRTPGQFRIIAQPAKEVKALQYWVMKHVLEAFPVHPAATGYRTGQSILDNATPHAGSRFLLKLDFKDFFPSLKAGDFKRYIATNVPDLNGEDADALSRILFWRPRGTEELCLSIGAPSSPMLSNILMAEFDKRISVFCSSIGAVYTRYADDTSFSANDSYMLKEVEDMVGALCRALDTPRLVLNRDKTVRVSMKTSRRVTGLVLTNDAKVSLGREQKRRIQAAVHHFVTETLTPEQCRGLRGTLAYVSSVEPEFIARLRRKYGPDVIRRIQVTV
jgi:retron-type reverse transcriptase